MATKYVNYLTGSDNNDGSIKNPWKTLKNVQNGANVVLQSGYNFDISLSNKSNITIKGDTIVPVDVVPNVYDLSNLSFSAIKPMAPADMVNNNKLGPLNMPLANQLSASLSMKMPARTYTVNVHMINLSNCTNVVIDGISVSLSYFVPTETVLKPTLKGIILSNSNNCQIKNCELFSKKSTADWTEKDWMNNGAGVQVLGGSGNLIQANNIYNCGGIQFKGRNNIANGNFITDMPTDGFGMWAGGNIAVNNRIQNNRVVSANHNDLLQCGCSNNNSIINNVLIAYVDSNLPFKNTAVQGIGCFDGPYNNFYISGNIVVLDHPIGIWIQGGINCVVENNMIKICGSKAWSTRRTPCVLVGLKKDNVTVSKSCIVRNNIAPHLEITCDETSVITNNYMTDTKKYY